MKRKIRKFISSTLALVLCGAMVLSPATGVMAADTTTGSVDEYAVTLSEQEGGTLAFPDGAGETYQEGDSVAVTVTPDDGMEVEKITVSTGSLLAGLKSAVSSLSGSDGITSGDVSSTYEEGTLSFEMPASSVTVTAVFAAPETDTEEEETEEAETEETEGTGSGVDSRDVTGDYDLDTDDVEDVQTDPVLEAYIRENADPAYTDVADEISIVNVMVIKQSLFDASKVEDGDTADSIMTAMENGQDDEKFIAQLSGTTAVYNLSDGSDYYVAYVDTMRDDSNATVRSASFALNDTQGNMLDDCIFDADTGLAYIPKADYLDEDTGKDIFMNVQVQLMQLIGQTDSTSSVVASSTEENSEDVSVYETTAALFDTSTTVQAEAGLDEDNVSVSVNGVPLEEENYVYDSDTGEVTVPLTSASIQNISVTEEKETLTGRISESIGNVVNAVNGSFLEEAYAATGASDLNFYKWYSADEAVIVDLPTWVEIGTLLSGTASYAYTAGENDLWSYIYWYSSPELTLNAVKNGVSGFDYSNVVQANSDGNFTVVVDFSSGNSIAGGTASTGSSLSGSGGAVDLSSIGMVALQCAHLDTDLGEVGVSDTANGNFSQQSIKVRILDLVRDGNTPYAVLGIYTVESHSQTGFGLIKLHVQPSSGGLTMTKASGNTSITSGNSCYSLAGAVYDVYTDSACTSYAYDTSGNRAVLTTTSDGSANTLEMDAGTYYVKERTASQGYELCTEVHSVTVKSGDTATFTCMEQPGNDPGSIQLTKLDKDTGESVAEGAASLAGAQFTVKFYAGYYDSSSLPSSATRTWVIQTKEVSGSYIAILDDSYKVSGDDFYYSSGGNIILPLGTYTVQETKAPDGYTLDGYMTSVTDGTTVSTNGGVYLTQVKGDGTGFKLSGGNEYKYYDDVIRGGVEISKRDLETGENEAAAGASIEGAEFAIISLNDGSVAVDTNGNGKYDDTEVYSKGQTVMTITTNADGYAATSTDALPYGDYQITEVTAPEGYLNEGTITRTFSITEDGALVDMTASGSSILNQIIRGGVEIYKRDLETGAHSALGAASLEGAVFEIISLNDGVTLVDTNGNGTFEDSEYYSNGDTVYTITTDEDGYAATGTDTLPYGKYRIREVTAPEGYLASGVLSRDFSVTKDGVLADMTDEDDSIQNQVMRGDFSLRKIGSSSQDTLGYVTFRITSDTTGESHEFTTDSMGRYDSSKYDHSSNTNGGGVKDGLWFGQYVADDGTTQTAPVDDSLGALPYDTYTIQELYITDADGNDITNGMNLLTLKLIVNDETMLISDDGSGVEDGMIDLGNVENTSIEISTTAKEESSNTHYACAQENVTIVDTILMSGLVSGTEYTLKGYLVTSDGVPVEDADGNQVTSELTFTASAGIMEREMEFTFDATGLENTDTVVFEKLYVADYEAATHEDIEDEGQTVHFPEIGTEASSIDGGKTVQISSSMTVVDTVKYDNLIAGQVYNVEGTLMDKDTGEALADADGNAITASTQFIPEESSGETEVTFNFNGTNLSSLNAVVFEKLYIVNGSITAEVANHEDLEDEAQAITLRAGVQTGDTMTGVILAAAAAGCAGAGVILLRKRRGRDLQVK